MDSTVVYSSIIENLVLAGIGSVCIVDSQPVTLTDLASQFFVSENDVGKNRAEATLNKLQELNPLVTISVKTNHVDTWTEEFISEFHSVYLNNCTLSQERRIASFCRKLGIQFFVSQSNGLYALYFQDLGPNFHYTVKDPSRGENSSQPRYSTTYKVSFPDYEQVYGSILSIPSQNGQSNGNSNHLNWLAGKPSSTWFALILLQIYRNQFGSYPRNDSDIQSFIQFALQFLKERNIPETSVLQNELSTVGKHSGWVINPISSVVGGIIAQEIIKSLSRDIAPIRNYFVYDAFEAYAGYIEPIGISPEEVVSREEIAQESITE